MKNSGTIEALLCLNENAHLPNLERFAIKELFNKNTKMITIESER